jgi:hypothetical protein
MLCNLEIDFDEANPDQPDFGAFTVSIADRGSGKRFMVVARNGLRLREGPGTQFDTVSVLRNGQIVSVVSITDGWARVDVEDDGNIDGFAAAGLLEPL